MSFPALSSKEVASILERMGYELVRQKGSHRIYMKDKRLAVVPMHGGTLKRATQMNIIKGTGLTPEDFLGWR